VGRKRGQETQEEEQGGGAGDTVYFVGGSRSFGDTKLNSFATA